MPEKHVAFQARGEQLNGINIAWAPNTQGTTTVNQSHKASKNCKDVISRTDTEEWADAFKLEYKSFADTAGLAVPGGNIMPMLRLMRLQGGTWCFSEMIGQPMS